MTTAAQELSDKIYQEVLDGETGIDEAIYALDQLKEYADQMNDVGGSELFSNYSSRLESEAEEEGDEE